ncbi:sulfurtransferase [Photobacterium sp. ZSDE20]|uniref:Rhodanese-like domain-containing protein n=1 Tax=Photobacterium pectinilyticum TaxID=2906793 RepID=A0ABT1MWV0_9GAMM|nr:rhodanese-like domain-containing protein [Photobacterium sp. ZSDE20]MCQ1056975.1 rhodanese-like domain-containing protein [Photobacterium sp. ZSDE20]MDD1821110.1 sulfurtransferase [Photobacterium sp. ZSDE20]
MSVPKITSPLVSVSWLVEHLSDPEIVVLDASWFLPGSDRNALQEWRDRRIPNARFFDFDKKIAHPAALFPHMLPEPSHFADEVEKLGISNRSQVVVYDSQGVFSAPRVWWMFRAMGHDNVAVLDGGLPAWEIAGNRLEAGEPVSPVAGDFDAQYQPQWVIDGDSLYEKLNTPDVQVLDARAAARFYGTQKEPREGVRSGHMPSAKSLPFGQLLKDGYFLPSDQLKKRFDAVSNVDQRLIFSCGSGVTACILALAAELSGRERLTVYDGSWTEWGSTYKYPIV